MLKAEFTKVKSHLLLLCLPVVSSAVDFYLVFTTPVIEEMRKYSQLFYYACFENEYLYHTIDIREQLLVLHRCCAVSYTHLTLPTNSIV